MIFGEHGAKIITEEETAFKRLMIEKITERLQK